MSSSSSVSNTTAPAAVLLQSSELNNEAYHSDTSAITGSSTPHLSSSAFKLLTKSPFAFKERYIDGFSSLPTDAMDFGSYYHAIVLEPKIVDKEFAIYTGKTRRGAAWEKFRDENLDKTIITTAHQNKAKEMLKAFNLSKHAQQLIVNSPGKPEVSVFTEIEGVPVKIRCDWFADNGDIVDLKTTNAPLNEIDLQNTVRKYGYDLSAALYVDAMKKLTGKDHDFYFVFSSKVDGCQTKAFKASKEMLELGRSKYLKGIELYKECLVSGFESTGEPDEIPVICLPEARSK